MEFNLTLSDESRPIIILNGEKGREIGLKNEERETRNKERETNKYQQIMPTVKFQGKTVNCEPGANLRKVLLRHKLDLYNGQAKYINCRGIGSCGTCAVEIIGNVSEANWKDKARRSLPPHDLQQNRRLACQTKILGDIEVTKYDGFWGQGSQIVSG